MKSLSRLFSLLTIILFAASFISVTSAVGGESFVPPVPDKTKILPDNDGGPDGCDSSRFKCVMGGEAVLDKQTGLVWTKNASHANKKISWEKAVVYCQNFSLGNQKDWRLPTKEELITLLDTSRSHPALPEGNPFIDVREDGKGSSYWTNTELEGDNNYAWIISTSFGQVMDSHKLMDNSVWPVRDGE